MSLILSGTDGLSEVDGSAATPAIRGTDANTGIFFPAADTIAFSEGGVESMRIDSSGNVGIGTSSPSARLTVLDTNAIPLRLGDVSSAPTSQTACYVGTATTGLSGAGNGDLVVIPRTSTTGSILFWTGNGTAAERMRIDSAGNVGIGVTSPQSTLQVGSVNAGTSESTNKGLVMVQSAPSSIDSAGGLEFKTSSSGSGYGWKIGGLNATGDPFVIGNRNNSATFTERMRIGSSGNTVIGATAAINGALLTVQNAGGSGIATGYGTTAGQWRRMYIETTNNNLYFYNGNNEGYLTAAGAWTNASDARLKNSIVDIKYGLSAVMNTQPRSYKMNDLDGDYIGFVAQELQTVIPEVVSGNPERQLGVDYGSLVAVAFKAIQEQQALIQSLTTRITALEAL